MQVKQQKYLSQAEERSVSFPANKEFDISYKEQTFIKIATVAKEMKNSEQKETCQRKAIHVSVSTY